jgi:hypothetical protein
MEKNLFRALFLSASFALAGAGVAAAQSTPVPQPTATPSAFTYGGYFRGYYFTRTNYPASKGPNQAGFEPAVSLHAQGKFGDYWTAGGTYLYANPFNNCASPASHSSLPCGKHPLTNPPQTNPDDTLPGYELNTLYEAYLQFKSPQLYAKLGNQVINTPWANASDSRVKPAAFQGADIAYTIDKNWTVEGMWMPRWEDRVQSAFIDSTLITQNGAYPDTGGIGNTGIPKGSVLGNNGFYEGHAGYASGPFTGNVYYYAFDQIANAFWGDAKYTLPRYGKPFFALQGGSETNAGASQAGKINSQIFGVQAGYSPWKNVDLTVGADFVPQKSDTITLPFTASCGANHLISGTLLYFLSNGTPNCVPAPGTAGVKGASATVYYGGWASPYTFSYATDPLFDTSISQGMIDRASPGSGVKVAGTFYLAHKQVRIIVSQAWYAYGNNVAGVAPTQEFNADATYFFNRVPAKGPYHGWSLRQRYADRTEGFALSYGALPEFKYNRTQLEYDF